MLKVKVIVGSTRPGRFSEKILPWIQEGFSKEEDIQMEILDLREYSMPFFNEPMSPAYVTNGDYGNEVVNAWSAKIKEADAFVMITPEYNHGYSSVLKNALDMVYAEWNNKPVSFISYGGVGGARAIEQLRQVVIELQMAPLRTAVHIQAPWFMQDESGALKPGALEPYAKHLTDSIVQLRWWGNALKDARAKTA